MEMRKTRKAALFAFWGTAYFFVLHFLGTMSPRLFFSPPSVKATAVLSLAFSLAPLLFFIRFRRECGEAGPASLKTAAAWAAGGTAAVFLLYAHNALDAFWGSFLSGFRHSPEMEHFWALIPWVSSALTLLFFVFFLSASEGETWTPLRKARIAAVLGGTFYVILRTIFGVAFLSTRTVRLFPDVSGSLRLLSWVFLLAGFIGVEYFYLSFSRGRDLSSSEGRIIS